MKTRTAKVNRVRDESRGDWIRGLSLALTALVACLAWFATGCADKSATFSMLGQAQNFQQATSTTNNLVDVLWVIDNSGSMDPLQQELVTNFNTFISNFETKGFDYKMAVTTTDAYLSEASFDNEPTWAQFKDGLSPTFTSYFYITPLIPDIVSNFVTNATQGANGSGDERAFQSMFDAMNSPLNTGFRRQGAFFAIIILSDEDDFTDYSRPQCSWLFGGIPDHDYSDPNLISVDQVVSQLDSMTNSTPSNRQYNVSAIAVLDSACQAAHVSESPTTVVGQRYMDIASQTSGVTGSVCDTSFANSLDLIQQHIVELSTQFPLSIQPQPSTIQIIVNGQVVPEDATNGWTYVASSNSIMFHGTAVPAAGASISVNFTPAQLL